MLNKICFFRDFKTNQIDEIDFKRANIYMLLNINIEIDFHSCTQTKQHAKKINHFLERFLFSFSLNPFQGGNYF